MDPQSIEAPTVRQVFSFGWNAYGQLGHGTKRDSHKPKPVSSLMERVCAVLGSRPRFSAGCGGEVVPCPSVECELLVRRTAGENT